MEQLIAFFGEPADEKARNGCDIAHVEKERPGYRSDERAQQSAYDTRADGAGIGFADCLLLRGGA